MASAHRAGSVLCRKRRRPARLRNPARRRGDRRRSNDDAGRRRMGLPRHALRSNANCGMWSPASATKPGRAGGTYGASTIRRSRSRPARGARGERRSSTRCASPGLATGFSSFPRRSESRAASESSTSPPGTTGASPLCARTAVPCCRHRLVPNQGLRGRKGPEGPARPPGTAVHILVSRSGRGGCDCPRGTRRPRVGHSGGRYPRVRGDRPMEQGGSAQQVYRLVHARVRTVRRTANCRSRRRIG